MSTHGFKYKYSLCLFMDSSLNTAYDYLYLLINSSKNKDYVYLGTEVYT